MPHANAVLLLEGAHQRRRAGGAADGDAVEAGDVAGAFGQLGEEPLPQGGHRGGLRGAFGGDHVGERARLEEPVGQEEAGAGHEGGVRNAPGVDVEHRHDRQRGVGECQGHGLGRRHVHRVQEDRTVRVGRALGVAGGAGGVAEGGGGAFVQLGPVVGGGAAGDELLVVVHGGAHAGQRAGVAGAHDDDVLDAGQGGEQRGEERQDAAVHEDHPVVGVADDERQLVGGQPQVERVQHGAHRRDGEVRLHVLRVVPHAGGDHVAAAYPELVVQGVRELRGTGARLRERAAPRLTALPRPGRDGRARVDRGAVPQDAADQ